MERSERGMVVRSRSPEEILDIYDIRIVLEAGLARCAADRRTEHDLRLLRVLIDSASDVDPSDHTQMVEANQRFHRALWRAGHNEPLVDLLERLLLHLTRYPGNDARRRGGGGRQPPKSIVTFWTRSRSATARLPTQSHVPALLRGPRHPACAVCGRSPLDLSGGHGCAGREAGTPLAAGRADLVAILGGRSRVQVTWRPRGTSSDVGDVWC